MFLFLLINKVEEMGKSKKLKLFKLIKKKCKLTKAIVNPLK